MQWDNDMGFIPNGGDSEVTGPGLNGSCGLFQGSPWVSADVKLKHWHCPLLWFLNLERRRALQKSLHLLNSDRCKSWKLKWPELQYWRFKSYNSCLLEVFLPANQPASQPTMSFSQRCFFFKQIGIWYQPGIIKWIPDSFLGIVLEAKASWKETGRLIS